MYLLSGPTPAVPNITLGFQRQTQSPELKTVFFTTTFLFLSRHSSTKRGWLLCHYTFCISLLSIYPTSFFEEKSPSSVFCTKTSDYIRCQTSQHQASSEVYEYQTFLPCKQADLRYVCPVSVVDTTIFLLGSARYVIPVIPSPSNENCCCRAREIGK